ncbi:ATPase [Aurantimonas sp. MSK8Z-1]|uniref:ATP12 family chaperone protein n=1 Tax=Mangrovibrevibacter kandeliae TaxID=2968473 RepID=UPI002117D5EC|nr:ATP12 family protein [Aurantimonas sp. MSK8Z-1]MCW4114800.1 ATPase [Aurantimonas sp. MSK8Z-1]
MSSSNPLSAVELPKRFYTSVRLVETEGGLSVELDGRTVKTPARNGLSVPHRGLAEVILAEWDGQGERIDPATMPATRFANTVIDGVAPNPGPVRAEIASYAETDLLLYRADGPDGLVARQRAVWDPILAWIEARLAALFVPVVGVMHRPQPPEALERVAAHLEGVGDPYSLAALHQITTLTGSGLLAMAVGAGGLEPDAAWAAAHLDEDWNIEQWGEDDEASARRALRRRDFDAAAAVLREAPAIPGA